MSSLSIFFSSNPIAMKTAAHRHLNINSHGPTVRMPLHSAQRLVFKPSAMMGDGTSSKPKDVRPLITSYAPSKWGDSFSKFSLDDQMQQNYKEEIEALKNEARSKLMAATSTKLLMLIDKLERFGLAYHFETEIEEKLEQVYESMKEEEEEEDHNLFSIALRFRLLRQHRYHVSCDAFHKFTDEHNKLKESLSSDVEGLLSLYEAAHVRIHDENVLEEAVAFTTDHLSRMLPQLESPLKEEVEQALQHPLHKSHLVLSIRLYIDIYEKLDSRDEQLLMLAKLNFNFMQNIFKNELFEITKWNMDDIEELPDYLKSIYKFIMSFSEELEVIAVKHGKAYIVPYFIEAVKQVGRGYVQEQKWSVEKQDLPSLEEFMINTRSVSYVYLSAIITVAVIKSATRETIDLVLSDDEIFILGVEIARLLDELASHQRETKDGTVLTSIDYYMKEKGVTKQEAICAFEELIEDKWKHLNAAWVNSTSVPKEIAVQFMELARISGTFYENQEDSFTDTEKNTMASRIAALLLDPILIHI